MAKNKDVDLKELVMNVGKYDADVIGRALDKFSVKSVVENGVETKVFSDPIAAKKLNARYKHLTGKDHEKFRENIEQAIKNTVDNKETEGIEGKYTKRQIRELEIARNTAERIKLETEMKNVTASSYVLATAINQLEANRNIEPLPTDMPKYNGTVGEKIHEIQNEGLIIGMNFVEKNKAKESKVQTGNQVSNDEDIIQQDDISTDSPKVNTESNKDSDKENKNAQKFTSSKENLYVVLKNVIEKEKENNKEENAEKIEKSNAFISCAKWVKENAGKAFKSVKKSAKDIVDFAKTAKDDPKFALEYTAFNTGIGVQKGIEGVKKLPKNIKNLATKTIKGVASLPGKVFRCIGDNYVHYKTQKLLLKTSAKNKILRPAINGITSGISGIGDDISYYTKSAAQAIGSGFKAGRVSVKNVKDVVDAGNKGMKSAVGKAAKTSENIKNIDEKTKDEFSRD